MATTTQSLGGYAITSYKEDGGEETARFTAILTKDGRKIAHVRNDGTGGDHRYSDLGTSIGPKADREHEVFLADIAEFHAFAKAWNADSLYAGYGDSDQFINHLVEVAVLNRSRRVTYLLDDQDYFRDGRAYAFPSTVTMEQALTALKAPKMAKRNPRVWDKEQSAFVPVV